MFKIIVMIKRRSDMTHEQFKAYYESSHYKMGEQLFRGHAEKYIRRYLTALPHPASGEAVESEYDAVTEMWFADKAKFASTMERLAVDGFGEAVIQDEEKFIDRSKLRIYLVEEHESNLN